MVASAPYKRTVRQFQDGSYSEGGRWQYVRHAKFAEQPSHYIHSFMLLQKDILGTSEHIEPADDNRRCYSFQIYGLFIRICMEIEANFKAILVENDYTLGTSANIRDDYIKIERSHLLSRYNVTVPNWRDKNACRTPFRSWRRGNPLRWHNAYKSLKHNRHNDFDKANFDSLIETSCGLLALLSAQFWTEDFSPADPHLSLTSEDRDGLEEAIGGQFRIEFPSIPKAQRYEFDWNKIKNDPNSFLDYPY